MLLLIYRFKMLQYHSPSSFGGLATETFGAQCCNEEEIGQEKEVF